MAAAAGKASGIVVGIDGSAPSLGALEWAARQAEMTGSPLLVITSWEWPVSYGWSIPFPPEFDPAAAAGSVVEQAVADVKVAHPSIEVTTRVVEGHPAPVLVEASHGASLLVTGCRGHGEFAGMLIGSVSEYCATHGHCPVVVHRPAD